MKAVVVHGVNDLRIDEVMEPEPGPDEVLLRTLWGGICGSDLAYVAKGMSGTAVLKEPMILGHELSGEVVAVGHQVSDGIIGHYATVFPATVVGDDPLPQRLAGRENLRPKIRYFGSAAMSPHTDGGFSEMVVVRENQLHLLPEGLDPRLGALAEPLSVALHAVNRAASAIPGGVRGRTVLVNGAGPIGLLVIATALHFGAERVIASDVSEAALAIAQELGAEQTVLVGSEDLPEDIELVFEASGAPAALGGTLRATARGGVLVQVGNLPATPVTAVLGDIVTRELTWIGAFRFVDEMTTAVQLLGDGIHVAPIITHEFALAEAHAAFAAAADPNSGASKVLLRLGA